MADGKHTPGPWTPWINPDGRKLSEFLQGADGHLVAEASGIVRSREENLANARLIAEAPAMYDLLRWMTVPGTKPYDFDAYGEIAAILARVAGKDGA